MSGRPEHAVEAFLVAWKRRDWTAMGRTVQTSRARRMGAALPRRLRDLYGNRTLVGWTIVGEPVAHAPALSEVRVRARWRIVDAPKAGIVSRVLLVNVIRETSDGRPVAPPAGAWGVNETSALREVDG